MVKKVKLVRHRLLSAGKFFRAACFYKGWFHLWALVESTGFIDRIVTIINQILYIAMLFLWFNILGQFFRKYQR